MYKQTAPRGRFVFWGSEETPGLIDQVVFDGGGDNAHLLDVGRAAVSVLNGELLLHGALDLPSLLPESRANFSATSRALRVACSIMAGLMSFN